MTDLPESVDVNFTDDPISFGTEVAHDQIESSCIENGEDFEELIVYGKEILKDIYKLYKGNNIQKDFLERAYIAYNDCIRQSAKTLKKEEEEENEENENE